jgi:hypothetical protein
MWACRKGGRGKFTCHEEGASQPKKDRFYSESIGEDILKKTNFEKMVENDGRFTCMVLWYLDNACG